MERQRQGVRTLPFLFLIAFGLRYGEFVIAMASRKKKTPAEKKKRALGVSLFLLALLVLVSLVSHHHLDDARITGEIDRSMSPFDIQYHNQGGMMGAYLSYICLVLLGWLAYFLPFGLILASLRLFSSNIAARFELNSSILFAISLLGTMTYNIHVLASRQLSVATGSAGGYVCEKLTLLCLKLAGELGSYIVLGGTILILLVLYTSLTPLLSMRLSLPGSDFFIGGYDSARERLAKILSFGWLTSLFGGRHEDSEQEHATGERVGETSITQPDLRDETVTLDRPGERESREPETHRAPKRKTVMVKSAEPFQVGSVDYCYPGLDLLKENPYAGASVDGSELNLTARMLRETLETFGVYIDGEIEKHPGPIITRYEFKPGSGIKVNQIVNLSDDLALALKAKRIRIIAPIPGKAAVGVEIPNRKAHTVYLRDMLESEPFQNVDLKLPLALGKTTSGRPYVTDLARMPHLLVAGATGSGKSVSINVMITSLLYRLHPHQVRLVFIDPKMLELSVYSGIPHLGRPVVTNPKRAERVLADATVEMESRYKKLASAVVRNIEDYNSKQTRDEDRLPYIVIFVDELADLMMAATSSKTELLITRLAQMSRAVGIHLILATQRPSVDVITGLIKANFPARIAFQVSSKVDSRTIIDANGAEKLLGLGDMLFLSTGQPEPTRIHGAFISSEETDAIVKFINEQGLPMMTLENITQATGEAAETSMDFGDPLFKEACEVVVRHKQGSVSLLQRRLGVGYQRAARLIDKLEQAGIVSPFDGSKARDVLVDKVYLETVFSGRDASPPVNSEKN